MDNDELTETEIEVLEHLLLDGANGSSAIGSAIGRHPNSVSRSLRNLNERGLVVDKGGHVWTLSDAGLHKIRIVLRNNE